LFSHQPATIHIIDREHKPSRAGSTVSALLNGRGNLYDVTDTEGNVARTPFDVFNVQQGKSYR